MLDEIYLKNNILKKIYCALSLNTSKMKRSIFLIRTILFLSILCSSSLAMAQEWLTDIDLAKERANKENKNIVLVFAGSDWCAPCIKLEKEIWESEVFKNYSRDNYILLKADFPRQKKNKLSKELQKHNDALAEQYNMQGYFPLVLLLDAKGKVLGKTGYKKVKPTDYINLLNSFKG